MCQVCPVGYRLCLAAASSAAHVVGNACLAALAKSGAPATPIAPAPARPWSGAASGPAPVRPRSWPRSGPGPAPVRPRFGPGPAPVPPCPALPCLLLVVCCLLFVVCLLFIVCCLLGPFWALWANFGPGPKLWPWAVSLSLGQFWPWAQIMDLGHFPIIGYRHPG